MLAASFLVIAASVVIIVSGNSDDSSPSSWYYKYWCANEGANSLPYLDDAKCAKRFPPTLLGVSVDREWSCAIPVLSSPPAGYYPEQSLTSIRVDYDILSAAIDDSDINLCAILIRRIANSSEPSGISLYNKYLCKGEDSALVPFETWSSSKIFAMANAAGHLRTNESQCADHSGKFGLDNTVSGKHGATLLGDLATIVCSYDSTAGYSSNSLSSYFHDIGWRDRLDQLVSGEWLGMTGQSLGGNYGEATPSDLGFTTSSSDLSATCSIDKDPWPTVYSNSISALSAAEMTRRIALLRDIPEGMRFPGITWTDVQNILYGAGSKSTLFPGEEWGGMTADTAIYLQSASAITTLLANSDASLGKWRIFSKLGAGYSSSRGRGEIVNNAYSCIPSYDPSSGVSNGGLEFVITVRGSVVHDTGLHSVDSKVQKAVDQAVSAIIANF